MYRLQCFGGAVVKAPDGDEVHFRSRKHLALLLYMAANPRRAPSREELARLLWDTAESAARHSLSQALYDIRRKLRPFDLQARGGCLRLSEGQLRYEGTELEEAVKTAKLSRVPGLYRGEFAPNLDQLGADRFDRWLESERTRYATLAQMALRRYAEECDLQGRWGEMCLTALRLVKLDPLDEAAHRALMRALWLHGDQQSALRHYSEVEEFLVRELPEGISPETRDLVKRIRSSRPPPRGSGGTAPAEVPLVGREEEFERLRTAVRNLRRGSGGLLVVRGPAGIGKTRLLQELTKLTPVEGVTRLGSRCYSAESDVAYGPVVDGVRRVAEELAQEDKDGSGTGARYFQLGHLFPDLFELSADQDYQGIDPDVRKRRLYEEVADLLRRAVASAPIVWIVEDVQWIDASSASLLHYVTRRLRDRAFLLVLSLRTEETVPDAARGLIEVSADSTEPSFIDLAPLPPHAIRELVQHAGEGVSRRAVELAEKYSGGNPFYALEILRSAEAVDQVDGEGLPPGCLSERLKGLLDARLRGLTAPAIRLLESIAVLERHANIETLAATAGLREATVRDLIADLSNRGLIREGSSNLSFSHDLIREFVYLGQGSLRRAALHLTAAEALARDGSINAATLAVHFARGGDSARTFEYALQGAGQAANSSAHEEAISLASIAFEAASTSDQRLKAQLHLASIYRAASQFSAAAQVLTAVLEEGHLDALTHNSTLVLLAQTHLDMGAFSEAARIAEEALQQAHRAGRSEDSEERIESLSVLLKAAVFNNDADLAKNTFEELTLLTRNTSASISPGGVATAVVAKTMFATYFLSSHIALSLFDEVRTHTSSLPYSLRHKLLLNEASVRLRLGSWDQGEAILKRALAESMAANDAFGVANATNNLACVALETGNWATAKELCQKASKIYRTLVIDETSGLTAMINFANALFYEGQLRAASRTYTRALAVATNHSFNYTCLELLACLGLISIQLGEQAKAEKYFTSLREHSIVRIEGIEERFKIEWFVNYMEAALSIQSPSSALTRLIAARDEELARDKVGSLKLHLVACEAARAWGEVEPSCPNDLHAAALGITWFERLVRRWFGAASQLRVA